MSKPENNDGDASREAERAELRKIQKKYSKMLRKFHKEYRTWQFGLGRIRMRASLGSQHFALIFICWHALTGLAGVLIFIFWPAGRPLGIALVVGSLFGAGSFISQVWTQAMTRERELHNKLWQEEQIEFMREITAEVIEIDERLAMLDKRRNKEN